MDLGPLKERFVRTFNEDPELFRAPGRVNIIGEHTDYNDGLVLPFPIKQAIYFAASTRTDRQLHINALDLGKSIIIDLEHVQLVEPWTRYFVGVLEVLLEDDHEFGGLNVLITGDIPFGAGISSSSALTCGFIYLIKELYSLDISKKDIVFIASRAENGTGVNGGKMDQFAICMGEEDKAICLDCKDYSYKLISNKLEGASWFLFDTKVEHNLAETEYNDRRAECDAALHRLQEGHPEVTSLRDVDIDLLNRNQGKLTKIQFERVLHVIHENDRVNQMVKAFAEKDLKKSGSLLFESHESLSKLYEVSCEELDFIVEDLKSNDACYGARMMGGGFGGSVIALIKSDQDDFASIKAVYKNQFGVEMEIIQVESKDGISRV